MVLILKNDPLEVQELGYNFLAPCLFLLFSLKRIIRFLVVYGVNYSPIKEEPRLADCHNS